MERQEMERNLRQLTGLIRAEHAARSNCKVMIEDGNGSGTFMLNVLDEDRKIKPKEEDIRSMLQATIKMYKCELLRSVNRDVINLVEKEHEAIREISETKETDLSESDKPVDVEKE